MKTITESWHRRLKAAKEAQERNANVIIFPMSESNWLRRGAAKLASVTYPPELLPEREDGEVIVLEYPEVPFQ
jgi:hypothetical protein